MVDIKISNSGIMGTGSNMFRTGIVHTNGKVYLGTYGPAPAIIWKYDPDYEEMTKVGSPGEYQLCSMVEAPNGKIYIGTAYEALVYEFDPETENIRSLGTPPIESTPWIFTMICTKNGEIYGAKGVGIFRLDWKTGEMESCGLVPGNHTTLDPQASYPIIRSLEERPDGIIYGDTNRWLFTFNPLTKEIKPIDDIVLYDDACYAVIHDIGQSTENDLYFSILSRYSGKQVKNPLWVYRASSGIVEPIEIDGLDNGDFCGWWTDSGNNRLLMSRIINNGNGFSLSVIDIVSRKIVDEWITDYPDGKPSRLAGGKLWFMSRYGGRMYEAIPQKKVLATRVINPEPAESRCLAASLQGLIGTYAYDCGYAFTYDIKTGENAYHGRVYPDDHRCNYGPAVFGGKTGSYFIANFGEGLPGIWVTDIQLDKHWRIGEAANQLTCFSDGTVWGTYGENPPAYLFDIDKCWIPSWQAVPGELFSYEPGSQQAEIIPEAGRVGLIAEAPGLQGSMLLTIKEKIRLFDFEKKQFISEFAFYTDIIAVVPVRDTNDFYIVLTTGEIYKSKLTKNCEFTLQKCADGFGNAERGCFFLSKSKCLVGIARNGTVSIYRTVTGSIVEVALPEPLPAGPAVDPFEDAWYFAGRYLEKYTLDF